MPGAGYIEVMKVLLGAVAVIAGLAMVSCATSSGTLLSQVLEAEGADEESPAPPPPPPPEDVEGLEIRTDPAGAEVWLNGRYQGTTPLVIGGLVKGTYRLRITRHGYHDTVVWLDYPGGDMTYAVTLDPILGFVQVDVTPRDADVTLDGRRVSRGITPLPVGTYTVKVSAFGYRTWNDRIAVWENVVTPVVVDLEPAEFSLSPLSIWRAVVNPENPGLLGTLEAQFEVTGPGEGTASVFDQHGTEVHRQVLPEFRTWSQRFRWRPTGAIPDGEYSLVISGLGRDGVAASQEMLFSVDRTTRIAPRSSWSGSSGLLYAPVAEVLPAGSFQSSLIAIAYANTATGQVQAPLQLSFRAGLGADLELGGSFGAILTGATPPLAGGLSLRWKFVEPARPVGIGTALEVKAALQGVAGSGILATDTFANFSGLSIGIPLQMTLGAFSLLAEPAIITSAWQVDYEAAGPLPSIAPATWMYWKAGVMLDAGSFVAGLSASARSNPLPGGILSIGLPVQAGAEFHWLLPSTHVLVGGAVAGEFGDQGMYLMGGIGLGLLF
jgi:hypothetical protein